MSLQTLWCSVFQPSLFSNHPWWWCYCQTAPKLEYSYLGWEGLLHKSLQAFREQTQLKDWTSKCLQAHEIASEQALQLENDQTPSSRCHFATIHGAYLHVIIFSKTQPILMHLYFHFPVKPVHMPISTLLVFWSPPFLKLLPSRYCEVKASKAGCQEIESLKKLPA